MEKRDGELDTLRFEVDVLRQRMEASIERCNGGEGQLIDVCQTMIAERELRMAELEQLPAR